MRKITLSIILFLIFILNTSAQFSQNFDAAAAMPAGWSIINAGDANGFLFGMPLAPAHSPDNAARIATSASAHNDYLITPQINVAAGVSNRITFWARSLSSAAIEHFDVKLSTTTATATASFSVSLLPDTAAPVQWTKYSINLSAYAGQSVYIGFHAISANKYELNFDDVVNDGVICNSTAPTITSVSAPSDCTAGLVTVSLAGMPATGIWTLYRTGASTASIAGNGTTATMNVNSTLAAGSYYFYYVESNSCTSPSSSSVNIRKLHDFDFPTFTGVYADTNSPVGTNAGDRINYTLHLNNTGACPLYTTAVNGSATVYNPNLDFSGNSTLSIADFPGNSTLDIPATYIITPADIANGYVTNATSVNPHWSDNNGGSSAVYTPSSTIQLTNLITEGFSFANFSYYPNPVKNVLYLSNAIAINSVEITSVLGQQVLYKNINEMKTEVDFSALGSGIYFVKIKSDGNQKVIKILRE